jgi:hypothetical protein
MMTRVYKMYEQFKNPKLVEILLQNFGDLKVQNQGADFLYKAVPAKGGHVKIVKIDSGEEYAVCCPHCGDTRFRLNISYLFGSYIEGHYMDHLAHCWNEDCDVLPELREMLKGNNISVDSKAVLEPVSIETIARNSNEKHKKLDGLCRIDLLPEAHPAKDYLISRGLDPVELGVNFGVSYCTDTSGQAALAENRIIYPLYHNGKDGLLPVGWQAGAIPFHTKKMMPKYWTAPGCMRSHFMYMLPWAANCEGLVLVEGAIDAHTVGVPACAILGRNLSYRQKALIVDLWSHKSGTIVLIGDHGFEEDWEKNYESLCAELGKDRVVWFTPEVDSNALGRAEIHRRIREECAKHGNVSPI